MQSTHGFKYVMICYANSCNAILAHPIKTDLPMNYSRHTNTSTPYSTMLFYCHICTNWTTKHQLILNTSLQPKMQLSIMCHWTIITQMQQNELFKLGKIITSQDLPASPNHSPLHTGASSLNKPTSLLT